MSLVQSQHRSIKFYFRDRLSFILEIDFILALLAQLAERDSYIVAFYIEMYILR